MRRAHEAQIREIDRRMPGGRLGLKVFLGIVVLPLTVAAVVWFDRPGDATFQMRGTISDIRTEVLDGIPPARTIATVKLSDGRSVRCQYIIGSSVGAEVVVRGARSRLLGRRSISC